MVVTWQLKVVMIVSMRDERESDASVLLERRPFGISGWEIDESNKKRLLLRSLIPAHMRSMYKFHSYLLSTEFMMEVICVVRRNQR